MNKTTMTMVTTIGATLIVLGAAYRLGLRELIQGERKFLGIF